VYLHVYVKLEIKFNLSSDHQGPEGEYSYTNEVEQWYVKHNYFIVLYHRLHVSTYIQVIFRLSFTGKSIKCYTCWDPIMLTEVKYIKA